MKRNERYEGCGNFNLRDVLLKGRKLTLVDRANYFSRFLGVETATHHSLYMRPLASASDREVEIIDPVTGKPKKMLMFGSNNYLGLANHPCVREQVFKAINKYGVGIGGPPLLNGYTNLHCELEERLSTFKHAEDTLIFSTGYGANVGLLTGLVNGSDVVLYDEYSHASFCDGLAMGGKNSLRFHHNDLDELAVLLDEHPASSAGDTFVGVEGVYSMDGDLTPLDKIVPLCKKHGAILIVDDAHGTGVMGKSGRGTAEHFGVEEMVDVTMGTFSKTFAVVGGFVSASKPFIDYLRFFARSYMFSASLPPVIIATVLAGLDVIEREPQRLEQLRDNVHFAAEGLQKLGLIVHPQAAIIALRVPRTMNIRQAAYRFHEAGIFMNSIEYPAVPINQQRFRISIMATHTREDINRLLECVEDVWSRFSRQEKMVRSQAA
ncbi:MAG: aminotransferase class I/II-fold pyridoxal phosphate-dependent enzyme [Bacteroidota bacterium]